MRRIVAKFGGTSLENGHLIRKAAKSVKKEVEKGDTEIAVVVSAMGGTTDVLISETRESTEGELSQEDLDAIMAMGEKTSAKIFAASLHSLGVKSKAITPDDPEWPIITDDSAGNATPDLKKTRQLVNKKIIPLMEENIVPVICGFLGKDEEGIERTLGRGGSDITAFLMGNCLNATDVILVTDAEGIMSADPQRIKNPKILERITAEELVDLARYGAKIVQHSALRYKDPNINAKVIHFRHGNLSKEGTIIEGSTPEKENTNVELFPKPLAMITIVGEGMQKTPGILVENLKPLKKSEINIFGVSIGPRSFSIYVTEEKSQEALELIHEIVAGSPVMRSATSESGVAMLVAESEKFIDTPGIISKLSDPLAEEGINVIEIYSSQASISFFVNWKDRDKAFELLKKSIREVI
ncbi:hypothetical protein AKJ40_00115 [candidate division MSBL1 archaeon SCGC-AAA259M10]|uniref:Aspartokinase n=1 Tax=candidate division MSBL1 archaeon SCGC-AAA259M10 TaxID=1698270 RepID=A0A133V394_9EURY|nr:hypothetical protein AKJ40_00115 [candidate division MSBL1 archaeon SCGC-AAA259M10]